MIRELMFTIPGSPKGKGRPRVTKAGHTYTPKDTAVYENLVKVSFREVYPNWIPLSTRVHAFIKAYYPIPKSFTKTNKELAIRGALSPTKKPDADNIAKSILDSLNGLAYTDDSQVVLLVVDKSYSELPKVEVTLYIEEENR